MTKKKEMNIKEPDIPEILQQHKASGIFYIPGYGILTLFKSVRDKIIILDSMRTELLIYEKEREILAEQRVLKILNTDINKSKPGYVA